MTPKEAAAILSTASHLDDTARLVVGRTQLHLQLPPAEVQKRLREAAEALRSIVKGEQP